MLLVLEVEGVVRSRGDAFEQIAQYSFEQIAVDKTAARALGQNGWVDRVDAQGGGFLGRVDRLQVVEELEQQVLLALRVQGVEESRSAHIYSALGKSVCVQMIIYRHFDLGPVLAYI